MIAVFVTFFMGILSVCGGVHCLFFGYEFLNAGRGMYVMGGGVGLIIIGAVLVWIALSD